MSAKVAFIGLGVMGFPMAGHLKAKGYEVTVYNRTGAKAEDWVKKHGGKSAATPAAAAKDQDFVMTMVGTLLTAQNIAREKELGIGRPYLDRDPPHVGPIDGTEYAAKRGGPRAKVAGSATSGRHPVAVSGNPHVTKPATKARSVRVGSM